MEIVGVILVEINFIIYFDVLECYGIVIFDGLKKIIGFCVGFGGILFINGEFKILINLVYSYDLLSVSLFEVI